MKFAWLFLLAMLAAAAGHAQAPSVFDEVPIWDQNGGPSIYDTYDSKEGRQPESLANPGGAGKTPRKPMPSPPGRDLEKTVPPIDLENIGKGCRHIQGVVQCY